MSLPPSQRKRHDVTADLTKGHDDFCGTSSHVHPIISDVLGSERYPPSFYKTLRVHVCTAGCTLQCQTIAKLYSSWMPAWTMSFSYVCPALPCKEGNHLTCAIFHQRKITYHCHGTRNAIFEKKYGFANLSKSCE